jgi:hypothetical protein
MANPSRGYIDPASDFVNKLIVASMLMFYLTTTYQPKCGGMHVCMFVFLACVELPLRICVYMSYQSSYSLNLSDAHVIAADSDRLCRMPDWYLIRFDPRRSQWNQIWMLSSNFQRPLGAVLSAVLCFSTLVSLCSAWGFGVLWSAPRVRERSCLCGRSTWMGVKYILLYSVFGVFAALV